MSFLKQVRPLPLYRNLICILNELRFIETLYILPRKTHSNVSTVLSYFSCWSKHHTVAKYESISSLNEEYLSVLIQVVRALG